MKNWIGLVIAISLGIVACLLNWQYLENKSEEIEMVSFLALKENQPVEQGDSFTESHFARIDIPKKNAGSLEFTAVPYRDLHTVISLKALHDYQGGELILRQDLKTPPPEFKLEKNEVAMWVPVNAATFVSTLVKPGDEVAFVVPSSDVLFTNEPEPQSLDEINGPVFGREEKAPQRKANPISSSTKLVGPFRVISLGSRLGSYEVSSAAGGSRGRENVLGIAVKERNGKLSPEAEKLVRWTNNPSFRQAGVVLYPKDNNDKKK